MFAQRRNIVSPTMWRMLFDVLRFNLSATEVLSPTYPSPDESVSTYLSRNRYSRSFQNDYLVPLVSSLWVHDPDETLNSIPVIMLVRYLYNHRILNTLGKTLEWLVVEGGAKHYVDAILEGVPKERLHKSTPVKNVSSAVEGEKLRLELENGTVEYFDHIIMATHAPDSLNLLGKSATEEESEVLKRFRTSSSTVILHSDTEVHSHFHLTKPSDLFSSQIHCFYLLFCSSLYAFILTNIHSSCPAIPKLGLHGTTTTSHPPLKMLPST